MVKLLNLSHPTLHSPFSCCCIVDLQVTCVISKFISCIVVGLLLHYWFPNWLCDFEVFMHV
jgi:hypothetical protein